MLYKYVESANKILNSKLYETEYPVIYNKTFYSLVLLKTVFLKFSIHAQILSSSPNSYNVENFGEEKHPLYCSSININNTEAATSTPVLHPESHMAFVWL